MSSLFNGVCYPSVEAAKQASCSAAAHVWGSGASTWSIECASIAFSSNSMSMQLCKRVDGGECSMILQPYPTFSDCNYAGGADMAMDWMYAVLPVLAVLWGLKKLAGLFSANSREES